MSKLPRMLVTGAAGAIGRVVFQALLEEGINVRGFDLQSCPLGHHIDWVTGSLTQMEDCQKAVNGCGTLIHLAAFPEDASFEKDLLPANVLGLHNILEAARTADVKRVILASTGQVVWTQLNDGPWPVSASEAPCPKAWYALTKTLAEFTGKVYARDYGMDVLCVRLGSCPRTAEHAREIEADEIARDVYFSPGDMANFFRLAVSRDWSGYHCVNAASLPIIRERFTLSEAKELLGYVPKDRWNG